MLRNKGYRTGNSRCPFWYETYVSKDVFVWVPALIVFGIMVATVKWATETIVRKTKTDTRSMGDGTTDTPRTSGSRASKSNPGLFSSGQAKETGKAGWAPETYSFPTEDVNGAKTRKV